MAAIRAKRDGTGRSLTPREARSLAGEWYSWWVARHEGKHEIEYDNYRDLIQEAKHAIKRGDSI
ncbi:MAG TPA: hypothetical protein VH684_24650 [Xanthobacteraceae bacterium]